MIGKGSLGIGLAADPRLSSVPSVNLTQDTACHFDHLLKESVLVSDHGGSMLNDRYYNKNCIQGSCP